MFSKGLFHRHLSFDQDKKEFHKRHSFSVKFCNRDKRFWKLFTKQTNFSPLLVSLDSNRIPSLKENIPNISFQILTETGPLPESDVVDIAAQLVLAIGYLHENNIIHGNLQPNNTYIDWNGLLRIGDFSSCQKVKDKFHGFRLKFPYHAPEVLYGRPYGIAADWWSIGALIYELITGQVLFSNVKEKNPLSYFKKKDCKQIIEDLTQMSIELSQNISIDAKSFLTLFLRRDEKNRMKWTSEEGLRPIINHPFFSSINWDTMQNLASSNHGKVNMNLTNSIWSQDIIKVGSILNEEYGKFYQRSHIISNFKTNEKGIIKLVWKIKMRQSERGWKKVMNERLIWQKLSSNNYILPLIGFFETPACYCFVIKYVPESCTLSYLIKNAPLSIEVIRLISAQTIVATHFCHLNGILLRNLSSDSFLIENTGKINLCNLESAKIAKFSFNQYGELEYRCPEMIQKLKYNQSADWFSIGIIIYELLTGKTPLKLFCENNKINQEDLTAELFLGAFETIPKLLESISVSSLRELLKKFLHLVPEERLGYKRSCFKEIKNHLFYNQMDWKKLENGEDYF